MNDEVSAVRRKFRNVNGILLLDKPVGVTSNGALQTVKRLFQARKAGHTGSLDPLASGLLPLCFGSSTKISAFLLEADKRYQVTVKLGIKTTTGDAEGEVLGVGAHVAVLRRTAAGPFRAQQMIDMERLQALAEQGMEALDEVLLPMEAALAQWPDICLSDEMAYYVRQGQPVFVPRAPTSGWVKLRTSDRRFLGMGQVMDDGRGAPKRLVSEGR